MKFVFFGYDFMVPAVRRLIEDGHELVGIMSFPCDNQFNFNVRTLALAEERVVPCILDKPETQHIEEFLAKGVEVFLSAGYPYKIPPVPEDRAYAINFHPSYLPMGRGIMPSPYIIMNHPEAAGFTIHKTTEKFDAGDILYQETLPLHERESVETLAARIAMRAPDVLSRIMGDLKTYWDGAKPQDESKALHFPSPPTEMRVLDFDGTAERIDKTARAFGRFGSLAQIQGKTFAVFQCETWEEAHDFQPGTVVCATSREITIACKDGFSCLKEFQELPPS